MNAFSVVPLMSPKNYIWTLWYSDLFSAWYSHWIKELHSILSVKVQTFVWNTWWWVNKTLTLVFMLARKVCGWWSALPVGCLLLVKAWNAPGNVKWWKLPDIQVTVFFLLLLGFFRCLMSSLSLLSLLEGPPMLLRPMKMMLWATFSSKGLQARCNCNLYPVHHIQPFDISGSFFSSLPNIS